jgi:GAF domain-containing protein
MPGPVRSAASNRLVQVVVAAAIAGLIGNRFDAVVLAGVWPWLLGAGSLPNVILPLCIGGWLLVLVLLLASVRFADQRTAARGDLVRAEAETAALRSSGETLTREAAAATAKYEEAVRNHQRELEALGAQLEDSQRGDPVALGKLTRAVDAFVGWERVLRQLRTRLRTEPVRTERQAALEATCDKILADTCVAIGVDVTNRACLLRPLVVDGEPYLYIAADPQGIRETNPTPRFYAGTHPDRIEQSGVAGNVYASGRRAIVPDVLTDPQYLRKSGRDDSLTPYRSMVCEPIVTADGTLGVLSVVGASPGALTDTDVSIVQVAAAVLARALLVYGETSFTESASVGASGSEGAGRETGPESATIRSGGVT